MTIHLNLEKFMQKNKMIALALLGAVVLATSACGKKDAETTTNPDMAASAVVSDAMVAPEAELTETTDVAPEATEAPAAESPEQSQAIAALDQPSS